MTSHPSWAVEQAEAVARRVGDRTAVFETGYGPSGLPHMGTVAEVLRTAMVVRAYRDVTGNRPVRFISMTDDMDGLRKVPSNIPNREAMLEHVGRPLADIPWPFGTHDSFAAHNLALLREALRHFGMSPMGTDESLDRILEGYETEDDEVLCVRSSDLYRGGHYDDQLARVAEAAPALLDIVLPELGADRRATWCPFVPMHDGHMVTETRDWELEDGVLSWASEDGTRLSSSIYGGNAKLQWRADWAMRWVALGVDFEMHGKDLIDSVRVGSRIARALGGAAPVTFRYELFLDEVGAKISKSVGNGVGLKDWQRHAPADAFWSFLERDPRRARRIGVSTIPTAVDDWLTGMEAPPTRLSFSTILAITGLCDAGSPDEVLGLLATYDDGFEPEAPEARALVQCAVDLYLDQVRPFRQFREPDANERAVLERVVELLRQSEGRPGEDIQFDIYEIGKETYGKPALRDFFRMFYEVVLGEQSGPRMGTMAEAVGAGYLSDRISGRLSARLEMAP